MGGVDLSKHSIWQRNNCFVPARVGGVDLSRNTIAFASGSCSPRPCGRGGFKQLVAVRMEDWKQVPARVGGVDLSIQME